VRSMDVEAADRAARDRILPRVSRRAFVGAAGLGILARVGHGSPAMFAQSSEDDILSPDEITVFPSHGTRTASPGTEISFRGVTAGVLGTVAAIGSLSGAHAGVLRAHSDEQGVSFLPDSPFQAGEWVTVRAEMPLRPAGRGAVRFRVAVPASPVTTPVSREIDHPRTPPQVFRTRPDLMPPAVTVTTPATGGAPGYTFVGAKIEDGQNGAMILDDDGELIWFAPLDIDVAVHTDVRVQEYRGRPVITMWEGIARQGTGFGHLVLRDATYETIATIQAGNGYPGIDQHECQLTPWGTALVIVYNPIRWNLGEFGGEEDDVVLDGVVHEIEIETGRVVFEWHSLDHIDLAESFGRPPTESDEPWDYFHLNSIEPTADGNFIICARHTHGIYKIERTSGRVLWRLNGKLSDFRMGEGAPFYFQHDARLRPNGELTLFDNVESNQDLGGQVQSRGLALRLDEAAMTATVVREYNHPTEILSVSQGNMQVLPNGNVFIGWGSAPVFSEFDLDGNLCFNGRFPRGGTSYRAYRFPWAGMPDAPPDMAVETGLGGELAVYASWNGATEVASWDVLAGPALDQLEAIGSASRTGFETMIEVQTAEPLIAVRALDTDGAVLGRSEATTLGS